MASVAVIDIGSNSIKVLVATRAAGGGLTVLKTRTIDARISAGISHVSPRLSEPGMAAGLAAVQSLLAEAAPFQPAATVLVATSAVRDAQNGPEFRSRVKAATGQTIRILTGDEEANLIGRGLTCDPALADLQNFYVFDLGGGSLECLAFQQRKVQHAASLQLGCVRLTEKFVPDPTQPFSNAAQTAITTHVREVFHNGTFQFVLGTAAAIGTGGTVTVARAILAARDGHGLGDSVPAVTVVQLRHLLQWLGNMPLAARREVPGLPAARADVMPAALATLIAVAEVGHIATFRHSLFNLRYGLAAEALERLR
ncbi:MAG TPA: phosphatase [Opitutaceae bacterium]|nr:phosphatase [Opitutaceae bacterium]HND61180.1 phosphatase [Opitutaceae bacterium]